jgi:hypothetical protein
MKIKMKKRDDGFRGKRGMGQFPRTLPKEKGRVIVHNHVMHTVDMPLGFNGFRAWTQIKSNKLVACKCGWSGLPHYRVKGLGSGTSVSAAQMEKAMHPLLRSR